MDLRELYEKVDELIGKEVLLQGWIRNHRKQKEFGFIDFNDGTTFKNLQVVYDNTLDNFSDIQKIKLG
ncbi:MAG: asparagine--tRNA ligase, partial [Bacilli bacterium]|nr:asparagine--tRNA ligase [Bacilli bacterium]